MDQAAQETVATTSTTRGRRKATPKKAGVAAAKVRTGAQIKKTTRAGRKQAASAAQKTPGKTAVGRKKGGRRKTRAVRAALPDSVMIALEIDGKQAMVSVAAAKNLYDSLCQLFG